jgi:serine/threonine protein kinase
LRRWVRDIVSALEYLKAQEVTHGDLKPANLLLSCDGRIKLADFGSACSSLAAPEVRLLDKLALRHMLQQTFI